MTPEQQIAAGKLILDCDEELEALLIEDHFNQVKAITLAGQILVSQRKTDLEFIAVLREKLTDPTLDFLDFKFAALAYLGLTNRAIK